MRRAPVLLAFLLATTACRDRRTVAASSPAPPAPPPATEPGPGPASPPPRLCWVNAPAGADVRDVWVRSASDAWLVGSPALALHWDGSKLERVGVPTASSVRGAWAAGPADVWLSTNDGTVLRGDGAAWQAILPAGSATGWVRGRSADDVWAGDRHWDGTAWSEHAYAPPYQGLYRTYPEFDALPLGGGAAIAEVHDLDVLAFLRLDDGAWSWQGVCDTPVAFWGSAPDDVWVSGLHPTNVGEPYPGPPDAWCRAHWNGNAWTEERGPWAAGDPMPLLAGSSPTDAWTGAHQHFDGERWTPVTPPPGEVRHVAAAPGTAFAVTWENGVFRHGGGGWQPLVDLGPVVQRLGGAGEAGWGVGAGGVLQRQAGAWEVTSRVRAPFEGPWVAFGTSPTDLWVVAQPQDHQAAHWDGASWSPVATPADLRVETGAATSARVWVTGPDARWHRRASERSGGGWRPVDAFGEDEVWAVWASGDEALALTARPAQPPSAPVLWRWDGAAWTQVWQGAVREHAAGWVLAGTSARDAWLALAAPSRGDGLAHEDLLHWDGATMRVVGDLAGPAGRIAAAGSEGELWLTGGEEQWGSPTTTLVRATTSGIVPGPAALVPANVVSLWADPDGVSALSDRGAIWELRDRCP